jgi:predicted kinase
LRAGLTVIVDAAFLKARERRDFAHLARAQNAAFLIVSCSADPDALARRIAERQSAGNDPSDADEHIMRRQLQTMEPLECDELTVSIEVDTRHPDSLQRVVDRARQLA